MTPHGQLLLSQMDSGDADPIDHNGNDPIKNFEKKNRQVVTGIEALLPTLELCNKIIQELK